MIPRMGPEDFSLIGPEPPVGGGRGAILLACDGRGRALLQLRDDYAPIAAAGMWSLFGGGIEAGEGIAEALLREVDEEIGVRLDAGGLRPFARAAGKTSTLYGVATDEIIPQSAIRVAEGAGYAYATRAQVAAWAMPEGIRALTLAFLDARPAAR